MKRLAISLVLAAAGQLQAANDFSGDADCVALWRLESALTADTIGSHTLTQSASPVTASATHQEGSYSGSFAAASSQWLTLGDASLAAGFPGKSGTTNRTLSVCAWVRAASMPASGSRYSISSKYNSAAGKRCWQLAIYHNGTSQVFQLLIGKAGDGGATATIVDHGSDLSIDTWYHVAATFDGASNAYRIRVYDAGAGSILGSDLTGTAADTMNCEDADLGVGAYAAATPSWFWDGLLDEVVVFKDVLTAGEIDQIRQGTYGSDATTRRRVILTQ